MIVGQVTDDGVPIIRFDLADEVLDAIIDTGFNGDLELPRRLQHCLGAKFVNTVESILAAGQSVVEDVFSVRVPFDGQIIEAEVTFSDSGAVLIGTHFLRQYHLQIDFVKQSVLVKRARP